MAVLIWGAWTWLVRKRESQVRREKKIDLLAEATHLGSQEIANRLLVVRAVDDEASLTLAFGAILNRTIPRITRFVWATVGVMAYTAWLLTTNWNELSENFTLHTYFASFVLAVKRFPILSFYPALLLLLLMIPTRRYMSATLFP
jgi:hypothetical protein